jgi:nucleotide-binding universal stress UspA family protein
MGKTFLVCTDGSDLALEAATIGLSLLQQADSVVVATVVDNLDFVDDSTGHAGPSMTDEEVQAQYEVAQSHGEAAVEQVASALGSRGVPRANVETVVLAGSPGRSLCELASELHADAIVVGSRGRSGLKRALLGSVSDYIIRNAPCSVVVTRTTN